MFGTAPFTLAALETWGIILLIIVGVVGLIILFVVGNYISLWFQAMLSDDVYDNQVKVRPI